MVFTVVDGLRIAPRSVDTSQILPVPALPHPVIPGSLAAPAHTRACSCGREGPAFRRALDVQPHHLRVTARECSVGTLKYLATGEDTSSRQQLLFAK
jgi:hypothetical protein